ncbi:MAG TPA: CARDB domain-containing protein, partial [Chloroflexota bacterium]
MRKFLHAIVILLAGIVAVLPSATGVHAQSAAPAVQTLFLGDRRCGDNPTDCAFPATQPQHRYLHVTLHDHPGDRSWAVWIGQACDGVMQEAQGALPLDSSGYEEVVIDLSAYRGTQAWLGAPLCYLFRGGFGEATTYYAAYFDDIAPSDGSVVFPFYDRLGGRPDFTDLDVTYIHQDPSYAFDARPNRPQPGQRVTYTAHLRNAGGNTVGSFPYSWMVDGHVVSNGTFAGRLPSGSETTLTFSWRWSDAPHILKFQAVPTEQQLSIANDSLTIRTDAITLGYWVERSAYTYFQDRQLEYCAREGCPGSDSFEDWLQRQVSAWNQLFRSASYPGISPGGISTRVRVDKVVIVPDGSLPLRGGLATNDPDKSDHTVDLEWGLPASGVEKGYSLTGPGPFRIEWALLEELGHARSLADLYRYDIPMNSPSRIDVQGADGRPVFDPANPYDPSNQLRAFAGTDGGFFIYQNAERDLMSCVCSPFYGPYDALILNRLRNSRALCGNANPPCNIGDWFGDIPSINRLRLLDSRGNALPAGTIVRAFYDTGLDFTMHHFTQAQSSIYAAHHGEVTLGPDPFRTGGSTDRGNHNLLLLEVHAPGVDRFCFQEPTDFNMAYWEGYRDASHPAIYTLRLGRQTEN